MQLQRFDGWFDRIGDWNPQLLRELKGRLKPRTGLTVVAASVVGQLLLMLMYWAKLPLTTEEELRRNEAIYNRFCTGDSGHDWHYGSYECLRDGWNPAFIVNWQAWWSEIFISLSFLIVVIMLVGGTYLLISDITQEQRRGTLNFIRLSPQSSENILRGKLLGVPALVYLGLAVALPLHWISGIAGGASALTFLGFYALLGGVGGFFFTAALLYAILGGNQAWLGSIVTAAFAFPCAQVLQLFLRAMTQTDSSWESYLTFFNLINWQWFYLPINQNLATGVTFALANSVVWTYWLWQAVNRRFRNPEFTLLSKKQSYCWVACFEVLLLGFLVRTYSGMPHPTALWEILGLFYTLNFLAFLGVAAAILPHRQTLLDWARYRHSQTQRRALIQDLLWGEKSPALVAIAINLGIAAVALGAWVLAWPSDADKWLALTGLVLGFTLLMIYAALTQLILFSRARYPGPWILATLSGSIFFPLIPLVMISGQGTGAVAELSVLFSPFLWLALKEVSQVTLFLGLLGHCTVLSLVSLRFTRQLRKAGISEAKALLENRALPS